MWIPRTRWTSAMKTVQAPLSRSGHDSPDPPRTAPAPHGGGPHRPVVSPPSGSTKASDFVLPQPLQLVDHPLDHAQTALPERRLAGVKSERFQQLRVMLGAAGCQHRKVALRKTLVGLFVDSVERVHQAVAERIGVDVERRMNEVADIDPEGLVACLQADGRPQALALDLQPDLAQPFRRQLAIAALAVNGALERIQRALPDHRLDHVLAL